MSTPEIAIIFIIGSLTLLVFVIFLVLIIIDYRKKQIRHITEKLNLKYQYQSQVLQTKLEVQEQSFKYVSEEIHDNIGQTLSLVKLKLYQTANKANDIIIKDGIEKTNELLGAALYDLRNLSHILNGGLVAKLSLQESIEKELNYISDGKNRQGNLYVLGNSFDPNSEKKLLIFRIVQESINNAIKHGNATKIDIKLEFKPDFFCISIEDNGIGFDINNIKESKGLGLHNIQLRAELLGELSIHSEIGIGTIIKLIIYNNEL